MSAKKGMTIVNIKNHILHAAGPFAILWSEAQKERKDGKGLNPDDVHFVNINDKRKTNGYYQSVLT